MERKSPQIFCSVGTSIDFGKLAATIETGVKPFCEESNLLINLENRGSLPYITCIWSIPSENIYGVLVKSICEYVEQVYTIGSQMNLLEIEAVITECLSQNEILNVDGLMQFRFRNLKKRRIDITLEDRL